MMRRNMRFFALIALIVMPAVDVITPLNGNETETKKYVVYNVQNNDNIADGIEVGEGQISDNDDKEADEGTQKNEDIDNSGYVEDSFSDNTISYEERLEQLQNDKGNYSEDSVIVSIDSSEEAYQIAKELGIEEENVRVNYDEEYAVFDLRESKNVEDVIKENEKYASKLSPNYKVKLTDIVVKEPDYEFSDEYYDIQEYLSFINVGEAWESYLGDGVTVAVIDSGIDTDNPEFANRISEKSFNATTGKVGIEHVEDEFGHGTSVAGVLAAGDNDTGIIGIAPNVELLIIKCEVDETGMFNSVDVLNGLAYALEMNADVINMSLGSTSAENIYEQYTQLALDKDTIIVAAAGNEATSTLTWPAADPNVLGVGAIDTQTGELASYSNYGENSDVVAPGNVISTANGGDYNYTMGTSLASPIVAGAIALYKQKNPYCEFDEVLEMVCASSVDIGALGEDWLYGYGELDMNALLCEEVGTITFDSLTDEVDTETRKFIVNHTLQYMPEPERNYLVFGDWYYDIDMTDAVNWYEDIFGQNTTLYANWINEDDGLPYTYVTLEDDTIEIRSYTGHRKYITVPSEIGGKVVTSIGDGAFSDNSRLRKVTLPDTITNIEARAFQNCSKLQEIVIPSGVKNIGEFAFYGCVRLSTIDIDMDGALTTIGSQAFGQCSSLIEINIPKTVSSIAGDTFLGTTSMRIINVSEENTTYELINRALYTSGGWKIIYCPANVQVENRSYVVTDGTQQIGDYAFAYSRLNSITIADSVTVIGKETFSYSSILNVFIPENVRSIGKGAFKGCSLLRKCEFGENIAIKTIPESCFEMCTVLQMVSIPSSVETIERSAFGYDIGLKEVVFAEGLVTIGREAFIYSGISEVIIPASVESIGYGAFAYGNSINKLVFAPGSTISTIGEMAFVGCSSLDSLDLPEGLKIIKFNAFSETNISEVTLPSTVTACEGAFANCKSLTEVNVSSDNEMYVSVDGVLFNKDITAICIYPAGRTGKYSIPEGIATIETLCFGNASISEVQLPSTLINIKEKAFYYCYKLQEIDVPSGVEIIERDAFYACKGIESVTLPNTLQSLGAQAFAYASALKTVVFENNIEISVIESRTFCGTGIQNIIIPASVERMGMSVFAECRELISVLFESDSKLEAIQSYTFDGAENITSVSFSANSALKRVEVHGFNNLKNLAELDFSLCSNLTVIDNYAIEGCNSLTSIVLPNTITYIGRYAFGHCGLLESIIIPQTVEHIGRYAFVGCKNLNAYFAGSSLPVSLEDNWDYGIKGYFMGASSSVISGDWEYVELVDGTICIIGYTGNENVVEVNKVDGKNVSSIGSGVFKNNTTITEIILPDTLNAIYDSAFEGATALEEINIPSSVTYVGKYCFYKSGLKEVNIEEGSKLLNIEKYAFAELGDLDSIVIPSSTEYIKDYAFYKSGIEKVSFENGSALKTIGNSAFWGTYITEIVLPGSLTEIKSNAFGYTTKLTNVTFTEGENLILGSNVFERSNISQIYISSNVVRIGEFSFSFCNNLTAINVDGDNTSYSSIDGVLYNKSKTRLITYPAGKTGEYVISNSVESIGYGAFESSLVSGITFEDGAVINTIGYRAFYGCIELTEITLPDTLVSIDYYAFAACTKLETVEIIDAGNLSGIYEGAFYNDTSLVNINIPDSVIEIGEYAFANCSDLKNIGISETSLIMSIGAYAYDHSGLTSVIIPKMLTEIGTYAFGSLVDNTSTSIVIPNTVEEIGYGALYNIPLVTEISIPYLGEFLGDDYNNTLGWIFGVEMAMNDDTHIPTTLTAVKITDTRNTLSGCFRGCMNISTIELPEGITLIEAEAFRNCSALVNINIPSSVMKISDDAFIYCRMKEDFVIPNGVHEIGPWAFAFTGIKKVTIPASVTNIDSQAFYCSSGIEEFIVDENNTVVKAVDGVLFTKDGTELWFYPKMRTGEYIIPEGVKIIEEYAFYGANIDSVVLPESLEIIESDAFWLSALEGNIHISANVESIESGAFTDISKLESFSVDENNKYYKAVGGILYNYDLTKIIYIPSLYKGELNIAEGIKGEMTASFRGLTEITGLVIPEGITSNISVNFCDSLEYIVLPDSLQILPSIYNGESLRCIVAGEYMEGYTSELTYTISGNKLLPTMYIRGNYPSAFEQKKYGTLDVITGAKSFIKRDDCLLVEMEDGTASLVKYSGDATKLDLDTLYEGGISYVQNYAFNESNVLELTVSEKLKSVGLLAFADSTIEAIDVSNNDYFVEKDGIVYGDSVTKVVFVEPAFGSDIDAVNIESSAIHVHSKHFEKTEFYKNSSNWERGCLYLGDVLIKTTYETTDYGKNFIKESTRVLADYSITYNGTELIIPDSVEYLGFSCLAGVPVYELEKLTLPFAGSSINDPEYTHLYYLFGEDCTNFGENIGTTLEEIVITGGNSIPKEFFRSLSYIKRLYLQGDTIKEIGEEAFSHCYALEKVVLPDSLEYIGEKAFEQCTGMKEIILPESAKGSNYVMPLAYDLEKIVLNSNGESPESLVAKGSEEECRYVIAYLYDEKEEINPNEYDDFKEVFFAGEWYMANFYVDGNLIERIPLELGKALHEPVDVLKDSTDLYEYTFIGWDITGDGVVDTLPATLTSNINAEAVFVEERLGYIIRFEDYDGSVISETFYGIGDEVVAPIDPTREGDAQYTYTFAGWNSEVTTAIEDKTYTAVYTTTVNKYDAVFVDYDGTELQRVEVEYGQAAELIVNEPTRAGYEFAGWDGNLECITSDVTFTAQYVDGITTVAVRFYNGDNQLICVKAVNIGDTVVAPEAPEKNADKVYTYEFSGWDTSLENITKATDIKATYNGIYIDYTVTFIDDKGNTISTDTYHYGDSVNVPNITKDADEVYIYTFESWDKEITEVTQDVTYVANYSREYVVYTVIFKDWDGKTILEKTYKYGDTLVAPNTPIRENDEIYYYDFIGWDANIPSTVKGDYIFTAEYKSTYIKYIVEFVDENGTVYSTATYHYGETVVVPEVETIIDGDTAYVFSEWDLPVTNVTSDATYVASFETKKLLSSTNTTVKLDKTRYIYDGTAKEPVVTLTRNGSVLVQGTDYVVGYGNNTKIGTATITIKGTGGYVGTVTASFTIVDESEVYIYGDANGDGRITVIDAILIKRYIAGYENLNIDLEASNVNGDTKVNVVDAIMIMRHLAGYDVVLGQQ